MEKKIKKAEEKINKLYAKLEDEISKAEKIHARIMPEELPASENIAIAAHYRPASRMGGDSYNVIRAGNKLIFYISDVLGHALDGAMVSVFVKEAIESYVTLKPGEISPVKIANHLAGRFYRQSYSDIQIICFFLGVIDLDIMELTYISAGFQTRPLLMNGSGERKKLSCEGLFISNTVPREMLDFKEKSLVLTLGTTILVCSDGLAEQDNGSEMFAGHYEEVFYRKAHLPPEAIVQAINKEFLLFNNNSLVGEDDISFIVLQVK